MSDARLYGKFTHDFPDHPKIAILSDGAFRCLVEATLWSCKQQTDGFLARRYAVARWSLDVLQELCCNDDAKPSLIEREEGWYVHDFGEHQETKASIEARRERNKRAGQKGGVAKAKRSAKQPASEVLSENLADKEEDKEDKEDKRETTLSDPDGPDYPKSTYPQVFEDWWRLYPRKDAKRKALEAWQRARRRATDQELNSGAVRYAQDPNREEQFTKQPATWLNGDGWLDDPLPSRHNGSRNGQVHKMRALVNLAAEVRAKEQAELTGLRAIE